MRLRWTPSAVADLEEIHLYIARERPETAGNVARRILEAVEMLEALPQAGRPGRVEGTRELSVPGLPYFIPYRLAEDQLILLRVIHGARDWPRR